MGEMKVQTAITPLEPGFGHQSYWAKWPIAQRGELISSSILFSGMVQAGQLCLPLVKHTNKKLLCFHCSGVVGFVIECR